MAFLQRLSQSFASYISPTKPASEGQNISHNGTDNTTPLGGKRRRASSPDARARKRRLLIYGLDVEDEESALGSGGRRRLKAPNQTGFLFRYTGFSSPWSGRSSATVEEVLESIEYSHAEDDPEDDEELSDEEEDEDEDEEGDSRSEESGDKCYGEAGEVHDDQISENSLLEEGDTSVIDQRSFNLTTTNSDANLSPIPQNTVRDPGDIGRPELGTDALLASGWTQDAITLMHRIVLRGYEPLLPAYLKFEYPFLPHELFASDSTSAFLSATSPGSSFHASKEFDRFIEISSRTRDCVTKWNFLQEAHPDQYFPEPEPELVVKNYLTRYYNFLLSEAGLARKHTIPLLTMTFGVGRVSGKELRLIAQRKCVRVAARWREALRDKNPGHPSGPKNSVVFPIPTIYAIACSWTVVVLYKYDARPPDQPSPAKKRQTGGTDSVDPAADPEPECQNMAILDLGKSNNDVWDALALACVGCHVRNALVRIARETGIGLGPADDEKVTETDDPDA